MRSSLVFLSALVAVHNIEYSYMTSRSIYMRDIRLATMVGNIHISLDYVTTFIVGSNISVVTCKALFIRL